MRGQFTIPGALAYAYVFSARNVARILVRVLLPLVAFWATLYFFLAIYLFELEKYLRVPTERVASLVLGSAAVGFVVPLFFHAVIVIGICELALGRGKNDGLQFSVAHPQWRLYAALLRFWAVLFGAIVAIALSAELAGALLSDVAGQTPLIVSLVRNCLVAAVLWAGLSVSLLFPPLVLEEKGSIVRRAVALVGRRFWPLAAVTLLLFMSGVVVQIAGEGLLRVSGAVPSFAPAKTLIELTAMFRQVLPAFLAVAIVSYFVTVVLLTACGAYVYRALVDDRPGGQA